VAEGVHVFRLNFSHGGPADHVRRIREVRAAAEEAGRPVGILQDLQGPKIRTGPLRGGGPVLLEAGRELRLCARPVEGDAAAVTIGYAALPREARPGDRILVSDGALELRVLGAAGDEVRAEVVRGGTLRERQGVNLPGVAVSVPSLTEKDLADLALGLAHEVDWVALSFVRRGSDVAVLKARIAAAGRPVPVIAKIEKPEAVERYDEILAEAHGIMVARGDLGVEISPERVPLVQKQLVAGANRRACPVITATQMLESMIESATPTRAEASDVANAILDGSDAVMLSGETAVGRHPVETVRVMRRIAEAVEAGSREQGGAAPGPLGATTNPEAIAEAVAATVRSRPDVRAVCVFTHSGLTAHLVAARRPAVPVLAFSASPATWRRCSLLWGVRPLLVGADLVEGEGGDAALERHMLGTLVRLGVAAPGDTVVVTGSHPFHRDAATNFLKLAQV
jgi:pyruvate kinase